MCMLLYIEHCPGKIESNRDRLSRRVLFSSLAMADVERLKQQVDIAQDEGLQITRNIRDIAVETHGIARDTAETLIQQGE